MEKEHKYSIWLAFIYNILLYCYLDCLEFLDYFLIYYYSLLVEVYDRKQHDLIKIVKFYYK